MPRPVYGFIFAMVFVLCSGVSGQDDYGGIPSNFISGNIINELHYSQQDSTLFVLTTSGLSYAKANLGSQEKAYWHNFGSETFPSNVHPWKLKATDSTVYVSGYSVKDSRFYGGQIFYKSKHENAFHSYDPSYRDDHTVLNGSEIAKYLRSPSVIEIMDDTVYVAMVAGTILRNRTPPQNDQDWRAILINPTDNQNQILENRTILFRIKAIRDSLNFYLAQSLPDSTLAAHTVRLFRPDSLVPAKHVDTLSFNTDSFKLEWETYYIDTTGADSLRSRELVLNRPLTRISATLDSLADSIIPRDTFQISRFNDTLAQRLDSLIYQVRVADYPPDSYKFAFNIINYSLVRLNHLLFLGASGGLIVSADHGKTFKGGLMGTPGSPLLSPARTSEGKAVQAVKQVAIRSSQTETQAADSFRVFLRTDGDTIAYSALVPSDSLDSTGLQLRYLDSLKKWTLLPADYGASDLLFYGDTVIVAYGPAGTDGLRKYYQIDTARTAGDTVREWRYRKTALTGILEPQLGLNAIVSVPRDTGYDLWAGTDEGLYRLPFGDSVWTYYEYKKPLSGTEETYAFPTVIYPGYKSSRIAYALSKTEQVTIDVFDFAMRKVKTIIKNQWREPGSRSDVGQQDRWDGRDDSGRAVAPGVYYYRITTNTKKLFGKFMVFGAKDY